MFLLLRAQRAPDMSTNTFASDTWAVLEEEHRVTGPHRLSHHGAPPSRLLALDLPTSTADQGVNFIRGALLRPLGGAPGHRAAPLEPAIGGIAHFPWQESLL